MLQVLSYAVDFHEVTSRGIQKKFIEAKYSIVEKVESTWLMCLMMVVFGCNVYPPGISKMGPAILQKLLHDIKTETKTKAANSNENQLHNALFNIITLV